MKKYIYIFVVCVLFLSCTKESREDLFALQPVDHYLSYPIDEDTRIPKFCLWTFEEKGKEYMAFLNKNQEILFYDIDLQQLVKKVRYDKEGENGVGFINSFFVSDFEHIYINSLLPLIYVTDSTGQIKSKIGYEKTDDGMPLIRTFSNTIVRTPMCFIGDSVYLSQDYNRSLGGDDYVSKSPLGIVINNANHQIKATPLKHHLYVDEVRNIPSSTGGGRISYCFDGKDFVYSRELSDSVHKLSLNFQEVTYYLAKSRYIDHPKVEVIVDADTEKIVKRTCELPAYGNIIYDKYKDVYYRFAFPEVELDKEKRYLDIYHNGRKQFSIIILDKDMNIVGETLFPEYTYNPYLLLIRKDGLYLSVSHFKRPDFDENVLRFQKIELVSL